MDFTREPIIESVITPREGCKLVVRSSKGAGQEEFFVDAVEVVSFGNTFFLRSLEKPKAFLVPTTDYEIIEVRETRMVLKNVGIDRSIKIAGGKRTAKEEAPPEKKVEPKKRERRRPYRKRRGKDASSSKEETVEENNKVAIPTPETTSDLTNEGIGKPILPTSSVIGTLLPPPPTLISESIERYKGSELFKDVFIPIEENDSQEQDSDEESFSVELEEPTSDIAENEETGSD